MIQRSASSLKRTASSFSVLGSWCASFVAMVPLDNLKGTETIALFPTTWFSDIDSLSKRSWQWRLPCTK